MNKNTEKRPQSDSVDYVFRHIHLSLFRTHGETVAKGNM